jgi:hypothetical protein
MSQIIPIYIPTYISAADYAPARVQPRLLYYNGQVDCEQFYVKDASNAANPVNQFPYFDNYSVVSGSQFPTTGSKSLLFFNEAPVYGTQPVNSLYSEYWSDYVNLLYNPRTRLVNMSAIIPLADYFNMELNDIVEFRGNDYHLRAINDYNLSTGECNVQLLGPILEGTFGSNPEPPPPPPPTTTTTTTTTTTAAPTTTTTTTTTTAPLPEGNYYNVYKYLCSPPLGPCSLDETGLVGYSSDSKTPGWYYNPFGDGYVYLINILLDVPEAYDVDLSSAPGDADCVDACNI